MDVKEKLMELLRKPIFRHELADPVEAAADYLIANGVTVQAAPTITYADLVPHGRWMHDGGVDWYCSYCKSYHTFDEFGDLHPVADCGYYYCPNCGAKMDGGKNNERT